MKGSIYLKTLADLRGATILWSLGLAAIGAVNVLLFPSIRQMDGLVEFLGNMPPVIKAMIGDIHAMVRLDGFLHVKLFDPLPLLLAVFGVSHGAQALAGELEHKHVDLLLARPVRRWRVVLAKFLAVATAVSVMALVLAPTLILCARIIGDPVSASRLLLGTLNGLPLSWLFTALAVLASSLVSQSRPAAFTAGAVVVASYVFETLRLMVPTLAAWRPVSLFAYHKAGFPLVGLPDPGAAGVLLAVTAVLTGAACFIWQRRDLTS